MAILKSRTGISVTLSVSNVMKEISVEGTEIELKFLSQNEYERLKDLIKSEKVTLEGVGFEIRDLEQKFYKNPNWENVLVISESTEESPVIITEEDAQIFTDAIAEPAAPNEALTEAKENYDSAIESGDLVIEKEESVETAVESLIEEKIESIIETEALVETTEEVTETVVTEEELVSEVEPSNEVLEDVQEAHDHPDTTIVEENSKDEDAHGEGPQAESADSETITEE